MPLHPYFDRFFAEVGAKLAQGMTVPQAFQAIAKDETPYELPAGVTTQDRTVSGRHGEIPVRIYRPATQPDNASALVWFHGGGFVMGSIDQKEAHVVSAELADMANCLVMSVDYRLVTKERKFPVPLEDGFDATKWLFENASELGVDSSKIFIGGASAGGSLAATVCLKAAEAGISVRGAVLAYPLSHLELPEISEELAEKITVLPAPLLMGADYVKNRNAFLMPEGELPANHFGWPAEESDLSGFPQSLFVESEYDAIRASSEEFIRKLRAQGKLAESFLAVGMTHGFLNNTAEEVDVVGDSHAKMAEFIKALSA
jgi:acetyl esterase/lipase